MADSGRAARFKFWSKMWMPLVAFALIQDNEIISVCWFSLLPIFAVSSILLHFFASKDTEETFYKWITFGWLAIMIPCGLCSHHPNSPAAFLELPERGTAAMKAHESLAINAALFFITLIVLFFLTSRNMPTIFPEIYVLFFILTGGTLYGVKCAREAGLVENGDLVPYFKTTALIAILLCGPHLYPGLNVRTSSVLLSFVLLEVIPMALAGIYLLMKYDIVANDTIVSKVDEFKSHLVVGYGLLHVYERIFSRND